MYVSLLRHRPTRRVGLEARSSQPLMGHKEDTKMESFEVKKSFTHKEKDYLVGEIITVPIGTVEWWHLERVKSGHLVWL